MRPTADLRVSSGMDRAIRPPRFGRSRIAFAFISILAAAAGTMGYAKYGLVRTASAPADQLTIATVHRGMFQDYASAVGNLAPRMSVFLDSTDGGKVEAVLADQGALVRAGQPLVRLNNRRLELEVASSEAQFTLQENGLAGLQLAYSQGDLQHQRAIDEADDAIAKISADISRYRPLVENGFYPSAALEDLERQLAFQRRQRAARDAARRSDRDGTQRQITALRASSERQKTALALIREGLANLTVTAPIDGQLTGFDIQPGQALSPGQRIGQIDRTDSFKVVVHLDEFYLSRVRQGQPATATLDGKALPLRVAKIYPDVRDRRFQIDLDFAGVMPPGLRAGQSTALRISLGDQPNSLLIENGAFYDDAAGQWAFVLSKDGRTAQRRNVQFGRRNPKAIEVLSGLAAGERVVTSSVQPYGDALRLSIVGKTPSEGKPRS